MSVLRDDHTDQEAAMAAARAALRGAASEEGA